MSIVVYAIDLETSAIFIVVCESEEQIRKVQEILRRQAPALLARKYGGVAEDYREILICTEWVSKYTAKGWL